MSASSRKTMFLVLVVLSQILFWAITILNWQTVGLNLFGSASALPVGAGFILAGVFGATTALGAVLSLDKTKAYEQKKVEWQAQDAKLMASISSDREKQLEAKIATLESALKTALKKK